MSEQVQFELTLAPHGSPGGAGFVRWHAGAMLQRTQSRPGRPRRRRHRAWWAVAVLLLVALVAAVELGSPRSIDPTGVDELEVPWEQPDPDAFAAEVDHAWWPLRPGAEWVHEGVVDGVEITRTTTVLDEPREVAGVATTVVREETVPRAGAGAPTVRERWYAQDRRGHLWLLGEEGVWAVGTDVPAGLVLAADPRRGDAHLQVPLDGAAREVVEVGERGEALVVPAGEFSDLLRTLVRGADGTLTEVRWARGTGPVQETRVDGHLDLVSHDPGD